ncbi:MBL fold metallo-hydrolase [candidate division GN15 bacterium]|nr:MBL fold metallo-hydrolase [candidate division GN15 bacterium]
MSAFKIADNVHWVGVKDPELAVFDIVMKTERGTTYNAYLVQGEKTALIDTAKKEFESEFLANVEEIIPLEKIDYLIVCHNEPDHSGAMQTVLDRNPNIKIICSAPGLPFARNIINRDADLTGVKDGHEIDLGGKTLRCYGMPYMHWPDTMMVYLPEDKVLFSNDIFAAHISFDSPWADEAPPEDNFDFEFYYYWDAIMRPFAGYARRNLKKLDDLDIDIIATSHGPLIRKDIPQFIEKYKEWSRDKAEGRNLVSVFYISNYGSTTVMAKALTEELTNLGLEVKAVDMAEISDDDAKELIESSQAILIGTPTFNGDAVEPVWHFTSLLSTVYRLGKKAAVFGSYGWGGEAPKLVRERLAGLKLKVFEEDLRARLIPSDNEMTELKEYAGRLAEFLK